MMNTWQILRQLTRHVISSASVPDLCEFIEAVLLPKLEECERLGINTQLAVIRQRRPPSLGSVVEAQAFLQTVYESLMSIVGRNGLRVFDHSFDELFIDLMTHYKRFDAQPLNLVECYDCACQLAKLRTGPTTQLGYINVVAVCNSLWPGSGYAAEHGGVLGQDGRKYAVYVVVGKSFQGGEMVYDTHLYQLSLAQYEQLREKFVCQIDHDVPTDAVITQYGHLFGGDRIKRWLKTKRSCPVTDKDIDNGKLIQVPHLQKMLTQLQAEEIPAVTFFDFCCHVAGEDCRVSDKGYIAKGGVLCEGHYEVIKEKEPSAVFLALSDFRELLKNLSHEQRKLTKDELQNIHSGWKSYVSPIDEARGVYEELRHVIAQPTPLLDKLTAIKEKTAIPRTSGQFPSNYKFAICHLLHYSVPFDIAANENWLPSFNKRSPPPLVCALDYLCHLAQTNREKQCLALLDALMNYATSLQASFKPLDNRKVNSDDPAVYQAFEAMVTCLAKHKLSTGHKLLGRMRYIGDPYRPAYPQYVEHLDQADKHNGVYVLPTLHFVNLKPAPRLWAKLRL